MDELSKKTLDYFRGKVVRKDLTTLIKRGVNVPGYVLEYLLGSYCSTDDEKTINLGVSKILKILSTNYIRKDEIEKTKFYIKENGEYTIIDRITGYVDQEEDLYYCRLTNFDVGDLYLSETFAQQYPTIFSGGIWCMIKIKNNFVEDDEKELPQDVRARKYKKHNKRSYRLSEAYSIEAVKPIQIPNINIEPIKENRKYFTTEEWINLMLRSIGIEGNELNEKEKFHMLERVVPLFEKNYNLVELGPRGTGKSYVYKEVSPHSYLISGGAATLSTLFYNLREGSVGLVGLWDCVAFDEVSGMRFNNSLGIQILKDYMASGSFTRGKVPVFGDSSLVFIGNTFDTISNMQKISHLFAPFADEFRNDAAFFDRVHYYLPGWEIPKIKNSYLTNEFGFISDYFSEFAREMRKEDWSPCADGRIKFNKQVNVRDEIAIRKTVSGLLKIIFPDGNIEDSYFERILQYAVEGRRRVKEQLRKMVGEEFSEVDLGYVTAQGKEVIVNIPEKISGTLIPKEAMVPGHIFFAGQSLAFENPSLYKIEVKTVFGSGKCEIQGLYGSGKVKGIDSCNAAFKYFINNVDKVYPNIIVFNKDYLIYINDILGKYATSELSVALFIALASVATNKSIVPSLGIVGQVTLSGTLKRIVGIGDYVRLLKNAGATKILLPEDTKEELDQQFDEANREGLEIIYYSDPIYACKIALNLEDLTINKSSKN